MVNYNFKPRRSPDQYGWHSRGYLPHLDSPQSQFLTFRLFDSMPQEVLERWRRRPYRDFISIRLNTQ